MMASHYTDHYPSSLFVKRQQLCSVMSSLCVCLGFSTFETDEKFCSTSLKGSSVVGHSYEYLNNLLGMLQFTLVIPSAKPTCYSCEVLTLCFIQNARVEGSGLFKFCYIMLHQEEQRVKVDTILPVMEISIGFKYIVLLSVFEEFLYKQCFNETEQQ